MTWQGVSEAECYDNRSVMAQIVRIKDRLTAVEQNVDPTLRTDLEGAIAELTALENTVSNVETQVETNTGSIAQVQDNVDTLEGEVETALTTKADKTDLTDGTVTKVGTADVGSGIGPIYLAEGTPTACEDRFFIHFSGNAQAGQNYGKTLRIVGSNSSQYPNASFSSAGINIYKTSSSKLIISQADLNITTDITDGKAALVAAKGSVNAAFHYSDRENIPTIAAATKPWTVRIHMSSYAGMGDCLVTTPDGAIRLLVTNAGKTATPPKVQVLSQIQGIGIAACSRTANNGENDVYIRIPTVYDANEVCATVVDKFGLGATGSASIIGCVVSAVSYEDATTSGGLTVPNLANYDINYTWQIVV